MFVNGELIGCYCDDNAFSLLGLDDLFIGGSEGKGKGFIHLEICQLSQRVHTVIVPPNGVVYPILLACLEDKLM